MSTAHQPGEEPRPQEWTGSTVVDRDGSRLGKLEHVYQGHGSDSPTWGVVRAGRKHQFVPLHEADSSSGSLRIAASKRQVRSAPAVPADAELPVETEDRLNEHYWSVGQHQGGSAGRHQGGSAGRHQGGPVGRREGGSALSVRRSRGAVSGTVLVVLGLWAALIPFVGPYFGYGFGATQPWVFTLDRLWLNVLPGAAVLFGGLLLGPSGNRVSGGSGALLALAGGVWLLVGPALSDLWGTGGVDAPIGAPIGSGVVQVLAQLGFFYALGALVTALAAFALGRLAVRSIKD